MTNKDLFFNRLREILKAPRTVSEEELLKILEKRIEHWRNIVNAK